MRVVASPFLCHSLHDMHLGDLPFELQLKVLRLCSRRDWASLSRTHTSLRDVADYTLYNYIPIHSCRKGIPSRSILQTLATNAHKASLVRTLDVQFTLYGWDDSDSELDHELHSLKIMAEILPNMLNLYKLRIQTRNLGRFWRSGVSGRINQAIWLVFIQATKVTDQRPSGLVQGGLFPAPASMPGGQSVSLGGYQENCRQPARPTTPRILPPQ
jgi:hypothetical protein